MFLFIDMNKFSYVIFYQEFKLHIWQQTLCNVKSLSGSGTEPSAKTRFLLKSHTVLSKVTGGKVIKQWFTAGGPPNMPFAFNTNCLLKVYQRGQLCHPSANSTRALSRIVTLSKDNKTLPGCILLSLYCLNRTDASTLMKIKCRHSRPNIINAAI